MKLARCAERSCQSLGTGLVAAHSRGNAGKNIEARADHRQSHDAVFDRVTLLCIRAGSTIYCSSLGDGPTNRMPLMVFVFSQVTYTAPRADKIGLQSRAAIARSRQRQTKFLYDVTKKESPPSSGYPAN